MSKLKKKRSANFLEQYNCCQQRFQSLLICLRKLRREREKERERAKEKKKEKKEKKKRDETERERERERERYINR